MRLQNVAVRRLMERVQQPPDSLRWMLLRRRRRRRDLPPVPHGLTQRQMAQLMTAFSGNYRFDLFEGQVRCLARELPGDAVAVICPPVNGTMLIIYDLRKPDASAHVRQLLREYWESKGEPVVFPDGTVEIVQRALPRIEPEMVDVSMWTLV